MDINWCGSNPTRRSGARQEWTRHHSPWSQDADRKCRAAVAWCEDGYSLSRDSGLEARKKDIE